MVATHGPLGLLKRSPNGRANGVCPFLSPSAMSLVRGSAAVYLLPLRSVRPGRSPFLAMISTWAFSSSVHLRKSHACAGCLDVAEIPATSPPMNVEVFEPSGDISGVTPHWNLVCLSRSPTIGEPSGSMPTLPASKLAGHVEPSCALSLLSTSFSSLSCLYNVKIALNDLLLMSTFLPLSGSISVPSAHAYGKRV